MNGRGVIVGLILLAVLWANTGLISDFINRNDDGVKSFVKGERSLPSWVVKDPKNPPKPRGDRGVGDTGRARDASGTGRPASGGSPADAGSKPAYRFGARAVGVQRAKGL